MLRFILWALLALYLFVVGLFPAAATPVVLAAAGAGIVLVKLPLVAKAGAAVLYLRRPARPATA